MISEQEQEGIKKILGHRYSKLIQAKLQKQGYCNSNKEPYSTAQIRNVMNGVPHIIIENAIWEVVADQKDINKKRQELLNAN